MCASDHAVSPLARITAVAAQRDTDGPILSIAQRLTLPSRDSIARPARRARASSVRFVGSIASSWLRNNWFIGRLVTFADRYMVPRSENDDSNADPSLLATSQLRILSDHRAMCGFATGCVFPEIKLYRFSVLFASRSTLPVLLGLAVAVSAFT